MSQIAMFEWHSRSVGPTSRLVEHLRSPDQTPGRGIAETHPQNSDLCAVARSSLERCASARARRYAHLKTPWNHAASPWQHPPRRVPYHCPSHRGWLNHLPGAQRRAAVHGSCRFLRRELARPACPGRPLPWWNKRANVGTIIIQQTRQFSRALRHE